MENGSNIIPSDNNIHLEGVISDDEDFDDGEKMTNGRTTERVKR